MFPCPTMHQSTKHSVKVRVLVPMVAIKGLSTDALMLSTRVESLIQRNEEAVFTTPTRHALYLAWYTYLTYFKHNNLHNTFSLTRSMRH